ncbi:TOM1-like protein 1 isoform X2 [Protopterus annectens]|uniref:TOM1-like protein 1 isoform X2 n=1 Tax=Protopterus annectens TaxID=7888 RepID=UPI001CFA0F9D|nr:TOM1-like protein 1 isoform X2 [Protopterus annectens]
MSLVKSARDPFSTPVGQLIERTTIGTLHKEDWGQFNQICDIINATEEGPKDAVKALKKRISRNWNQTEVRLSLSLLEICMQNCHARFRSLVVKKEFCRDVLVKMLKPKYNPPIDVQNKILGFIMTWSSGFPGSVDVSEVKDVYIDLIKKGVTFPSAEAAAAPLNIASSQTSAPVSTSSSSVSLKPTAGPQMTCITTMTSEQIAKLHSELDMVQINVNVMSAILLENTHGNENPEDCELLQKLYDTCRLMQERIIELLATMEMDDIASILLQMNDNLNNVFLRYERFSRGKISSSQRTAENSEFNEISNSETRQHEPPAPVNELLDLSLNSPAPQAESTGQSTGFQSPISNEYVNRPLPVPSLYPGIPISLQAMASSPLVPHTNENMYQHPMTTPVYSNLSYGPPLPSLLESQTLPSFDLKPVTYSSPSFLVPVPCSSSAEMKSSTETSNFYSLVEFDPCAANGTSTDENIYEDLEEIFQKNEGQMNTSC